MRTRTWAEIDGRALAHNLRAIRRENGVADLHGVATRAADVEHLLRRQAEAGRPALGVRGR